MTGLIVVGAIGAALHLGLLAVSRPRSASSVAAVLLWLANIALIATVAASVSPHGWLLATGVYAGAVGVAMARFADWNVVARAFFAYLLASAVLYVAYVADLTFFGGLGLGAAVISGLLLLFEVLAIALTLVYAYESLETLARVRWRRLVSTPPAPFADTDAPLVSIHVPTYSEPPELVIETLNALSRLDYPRFEVIVIDNNTADPALWTPVERHCEALGERFRFFHVAPLSGFKAGACNFALTKTDPAAQIVAILDADYLVDPEFLRETVPHFRDPRIAFVQTPQDYREFEGNRYLTDCLHAYAYFFAVSMRTRNEQNAAIFGGTMGLIRRSALEQIGGWDEWCITEDAEASLRILQRGYSSLYVHRSYGRGLMPFDFDSYKKQRFRWAFGGVQILRKHWRSLLPFVRRPAGDRLTAAQRAWYLAAALLWFGEPLQVAFAAFLIAGGVGYALGIGTIARPLAEAILLFPLLFLGLGIVRFLWVLRAALGLSLRDAVGAAVSMFSLSWVVTEAALTAIVRSGGVFLRTSKARSTSTLALALHAARSETILALVCLAIGVLTLSRGLSPLALGIATFCAWQAIVYGSAFVTSLAAVRSAASDTRPARYRRRREYMGARVRDLSVAAAAAASLALFLMLGTSALAPGIAEDFTRVESTRQGLVPAGAFATPAPSEPEGPTTPGTRPAQPTPVPVASRAPTPSGPPARATPSLPPPASAAPTPPVPGPPSSPPGAPASQPGPPGGVPAPTPPERAPAPPTARGLGIPIALPSPRRT